MANGIFQEHIVDYLNQFSPERDDILKEMEAYASMHDVPIIGPQEGALLHIIAKKSNSMRILELGTAIGYSATWLARALPPGGKLTTIEWSEETAEIAKKNLAKAGVREKVDIMMGSAQELLPNMSESFDLIFNDIDKTGYVDILPHCISHLEKGGLLATDNVLRHGYAARPPSEEDDPETVTIREYNRRICAHPELMTVIVPIRDGLSISMKI
jgi:predicted O-methyltransferase YrrM